MQHRVSHPQVHPVLTRFAINERAFLGLLAARPKRGRRRQRRAQSWVSQELHLLGKDLAKNILNGVIVVIAVVALFWFGPRVFYAFFPPTGNQAQAESLSGNFDPQVDEAILQQQKAQAPAPTENYLPPVNENLPTGDWLVVPRIGVRSTLQPTENYEDALNTGLWWAPGYGGPGDKDKPMIVAGHRFGFKWWWQDDYWKYHSFYMLPTLEPGDSVQVISGQRQYTYEVYAGEEGTEITDYTADLILYTCKYLDSPIRIFRYARLVVPEKKTPLGGL